MFYMKHGGEILEIESDNVYTICPKCGKEHTVELDEILKGEYADLYGTSVYCNICSADVAKQRCEAEHHVLRFPGQ